MNYIKDDVDIKFESVVLRGDYSKEQIDEAVSSLSMEECFELIPNPSDFNASYHVHVGNCKDVYHMMHVRPSFKGKTNWFVGISDWFGSRDQIQLYASEGPDLLKCLRDVVQYCCRTGILPQERFDKIVLPKVPK